MESCGWKCADAVDPRWNVRESNSNWTTTCFYKLRRKALRSELSPRRSWCTSSISASENGKTTAAAATTERARIAKYIARTSTDGTKNGDFRHKYSSVELAALGSSLGSSEHLY